MGPLQYVIIEFKGNKFTGEIMPLIDEVRAKEIVRVLDLVLVSRDEEGKITEVEVSDLPREEAEFVASAVDETAGLWFSQEDIDRIGKELPNTTSVALLLMEHLWAKPIEEAVSRANGSLLVEGFVPRDVVHEVEELTHQY